MTSPAPSPSAIDAGANRKIHVLHVVTSLEPGGLENGVVNLANLLNPERFQTSIVCLERVGEFAKRLGKDVPLTCLEKPPGFRASAVLKLSNLISQTRPDILHTHNLGPLIYGSLASRTSRKRPVLLQGEHAQLREDEKTLKRRLVRKCCYQKCRGIHTVSEGLRDDLIANGYPEHKITAILNGVDTQRFSQVTEVQKADLRRHHGIPPESMVIGIVGRFGAFKGHAKLIEGFNQLATKHPELRLLMVGDDGPNKEAVLAAAQASPHRERIIWSGFQAEPADHYRMMDLLIVPSDNEGLSNAILEAMACGVPCLTHPACGASEVVVEGINGLLLPMMDADQLAGAIKTAIADTERLRNMGAQARGRAVEAFSINSMLSGYAGLYETICPNPSKR